MKLHLFNIATSYLFGAVEFVLCFSIGDTGQYNSLDYFGHLSSLARTRPVVLLCTADALFGDTHNAVICSHEVMKFGRARFGIRLVAKCPTTVKCTLTTAASVRHSKHNIAKLFQRNAASWTWKGRSHN